MADAEPIEQRKTIAYECDLCDKLSRAEEQEAHSQIPEGPTVDISLVYKEIETERGELVEHLFVVTGDNSKPGEDHKYRYQGRSLDGSQIPEDFDGQRFFDRLRDCSYSILKDDDPKKQDAMIEEARAAYQAEWDEMDEEKRAEMPKPEDLVFRISPKISKSSK